MVVFPLQMRIILLLSYENKPFRLILQWYFNGSEVASGCYLRIHLYYVESSRLTYNQYTYIDTIQSIHSYRYTIQSIILYRYPFINSLFPFPYPYTYIDILLSIISILLYRYTYTYIFPILSVYLYRYYHIN